MNPAPSEEPTPLETPAPAHYGDETTHPDPITGEPGAHPVGVGVGAIGAGLAGAAIGAIAGPVGVLIGAAIGAVAGGLAGKEVAASDDDQVVVADPSVPTATGAGTVLAGAGMSGMSGLYDGGVPAAALAAGMGLDLRKESAAGVEGGDVAGSNTDETTGVGAGQFHDAFTATTLRETEEEDRIASEDEDTPDLMSATESLRVDQKGPDGEVLLGGTAFGRAHEREEQIRKVAYFLFLERQTSGATGDALGDWLSAERDFAEA